MTNKRLKRPLVAQSKMIRRPARRTLPTEKVSSWWETAGIMFAGGWHPLTGRIRAGGQPDNLEEGYEWEYTYEHIRRLKELGITVLISQFDRGLGEADQAEHQEKARLQARLCHKYGLRHGVYMANTVYFESMLKDHPECEDWVVKTYDNRFAHYGGEQTWRWVACFNSPGWRDRMKYQIKKAIDHVKTDWLHFDNLAVWPEPDSCHCCYCQEAFRKFLQERYPTAEAQKHRFGFTGFDTFRAPNFYLRFSKPWDLDRIQNPLMQEWILFRCRTVTDYTQDMAQYARQLKPDVCIDGNGQAVWGTNKAFMHGIDSEAQSAQLDVVIDENHDYRPDDDPRAIFPVTISMRGMNFCRRLGKRLLTSYNDEEALAFNLTFAGDPGINMQWGYAEPGRRPLNPYQPGVKELLDHYKRHLPLYTPVKPANRIAVWRSNLSLAFISTYTHLSVCVMEHLLFTNRIPFSIVFDGFISDERLSDFDLLVLPDSEFVSDDQIQVVSRFVEKGGSLLITERSGAYMDKGRLRTTPAFRHLFGKLSRPASLALCETTAFDQHAQFTLRGQEDFPAFAQYGKGRVAYLPKIDYVHPPRAFKSCYNAKYDGIDSRYWKEPFNHKEILDAIRWLYPLCEPVKVFGVPELRLDYVSWSDGSRGALMVRCGRLSRPRNIPFAVRSSAPLRRARLYKPEHAGTLALEWEKRNGYYETMLYGIMRHVVVKFQ